MRHLRHVLQEVLRLGKAGTTTTIHAPARQLGGLSLSSTRDKRATAGVVNPRRTPTGPMELRRAAEVQKCADKVRAVNVDVDVDTEKEMEMMMMTAAAAAATAANAKANANAPPRRFRAVSGLVPPSRSNYTSRSGWKSALICLGNMRKGGVAPGSAAYNVALKACVGAREFDRAAALLEDMEGSGATPDAAIVREIKAAAGGGGGIRLMDKDGDSLTCDAASPDSDASRKAATSGGGGGGSRRSMSGLSGSASASASGGRGSVAGMHTVAAGADIDWPSRRPEQECNGSCNGSNSSGREADSSGELLMSLDPFSLGPTASSTGSMSGGGGGGSSSSSGGGAVAGMHTVAAGADGVWPSRRPTRDGGGGSDGDRCRSLAHVAWGGERERWHEHQHEHLEDGGTAGSHAGVAGREGVWLSAKADPFGGSWGDD